jgi:cation diffusion facilitator family transporter
MHAESIERWQHHHDFLGEQHQRHERRTWLVVGLTAAMMAAEIVGGTVFGSMALLADGWHMATHASALAIAALAYSFARRRTGDPRFSFGTGKLGELAGFSSALILAMIALLIAYESVARFLNPVGIAFGEAVAIAVLGLGVNLLSAWLLRGEHHHHHADDDEDEHHHGHDDHNLRAAYVHVLADALTSVLAIGALLAAWHFGWVWIDPLVGVVGAAVIISWAVKLIRSAGAVLLDTVPNPGLLRRVRERLETRGDRVADLHLWRVGPGHAALIVSIVSGRPESPDAYKARLAGIHGLSHVTVEVRLCPEHASGAAAA